MPQTYLRGRSSLSYPLGWCCIGIVLRPLSGRYLAPLYSACFIGHTDVIAMLLARDEIAVNKATTDDGLTPLHSAAINGHLAIAQLLSVYAIHPGAAA